VTRKILQDRHGNLITTSVELLCVISNRLWNHYELRNERRGNGSLVFKDKLAFDRAIRRGYHRRNIELAFQLGNRKTTPIFSVYEAVEDYVFYYIERAGKSKSDKVFIKTGLRYPKRFPKCTKADLVLGSERDPLLNKRAELTHVVAVEKPIFQQMTSQLKKQLSDTTRNAFVKMRKFMAKPFQKIGDTIAGE